ncbi:MAG: biotin transporter BioY [Lachnospiraceae bacterium]|nr:biotin transporter BioY [Lachnospiraceae bacterium]
METTKTDQPVLKTIDLVYIGIFAVLIAICSWISIPAAVPFTLQTFGIFVTARILGGKRTVFAVLVYLLMGCIGLPVFSGFGAGAGVLMGSTGGYLIGFLFSALVIWLFEKVLGCGKAAVLFSMVIGLVVCYAFGTIWFLAVYAKTKGPISVMTALGWCVFPFIIPDLIKIALAFVVGERVKKQGIGF